MKVTIEEFRDILMMNGHNSSNNDCKEVMQEFPMEFAVEAQKLIGISLEGSGG